jgi:predicted RNA binding protein YcfA (HicA-like mRNA interferase family)
MKNQIASNLRYHQENGFNLIYQRGSKRKQEITDLESLDHAYVVAPNKIDEDRKTNLIKSIFKSWPPVRFRKRPPFRAPILSQRTPIHAGSLGRVR